MTTDTWTPTHYSLSDGSTVRLIDVLPGHPEDRIRVVLENECGDRWTDYASDWAALPADEAPNHCASTDRTHDFDHREIRRLETEVRHLRGLVRAIHRTSPIFVMQKVSMDGHEYNALRRALESSDV